MTSRTSPERETTTTIPAGTWRSDPTHSSVGFSVRHMVVATFRGTLPEFEVTLAGGEEPSLVGVGQLASITTQDENLTAHLHSPDFFDIERHPEIRFEAHEILRDGEHVRVPGALTLKGVTEPLELTGTLTGPVEVGETEVLGLELEGSIDRRRFGIEWNMPLPDGGLAVGHTVRLQAELELRRAD